ncbi:MAG: hypothetical protein ACD_69C00128G0001 [uncultured bacterium]|nr:MAG: hypothetical protein ACD_69C00128G0001 [uncultured bacterium]
MTSDRQSQMKQILDFIANGLNIVDPNRVDIRGSLQVGNSVYVDINVIFIGTVVLGDNVKIGPGCVINNATINKNTQIKEYSSVEGSEIGEECTIGPYARIRPSSNIGSGSQIGNFVEIKNTVMGNGCKINHHSFIGDAILGLDVIIGAGCITCNFDGKNTVVTIVDNKAYIGAGVQLVAPIKIGASATIGAGSTITEDVNENSTVLARSRQITIKNGIV